jgi:hypothetical protein
LLVLEILGKYCACICHLNDHEKSTKHVHMF